MMSLDPYIMALRIPALLIAITVHEFSHARMAYHFGDATAKTQGRLSLNPITHLDPIGTLMIILVGFGWAKPVPINPYNFRDYRKGLLWVSLAGPLSNFVLAFLTLFIFYLMAMAGIVGLPLDMVSTLIQLNILLGVFNLLPIPPLDGSKIVLSLAGGAVLSFYRQIEPYAPLILLMLIILPLGPRGSLLGAIIWPLFGVILSLMDTVVRFVFGIF